MRGGGPLASVDSSGLIRGKLQVVQGIDQAAQGFNRLGANLQEIDQRDRQRQVVSDYAKAEATWTAGSLELGNSFAQDTDWRTFNERAGKQTEDLKQKAASLIRDPEARQRFLGDTELRRLATVDAINDHGRDLSQEEDRVGFENALVQSARLISDPNIGDTARKKAIADISASIDLAQHTGLVTPKEAQALRDKHLTQADEQLAINRAYLNGQTDPNGVIKALGFPAPGKTGDVDPLYQSLDAQQRLEVADHMRVMANQQQVDKRVAITTAAENAPAAITNTGTYTGQMPTEADYIAAYGEAAGPEGFKQFQYAIDTAHTAYGFRTESEADIRAAVDAAVPKSSGDEAANETRAYDRIATAAQHVLKARADDPAGYVLQTYPNVAQAWQDVGKDPSKFAAAVTAMDEAQKALGIETPALLPKDMADKAAATFKDPNLSQDERVGAVTGLVLGTQDETQQRAIYDQLVKAGVPPNTQAAMDALTRGDTGAAQYLFRAALIDPKELPLDAKRFPPADVSEALAGAFEDGSVADIVYGISDGTAKNFERAGLDAGLMERAVKLRLLDGSAATVDQAVEMTTRDMFGDVKVVQDQNVRIVLPTSEDDAPMRAGFDALTGQVADALMQNMSPALDGAATNTGEAAILTTARDRYVEQVIDQGYFTNFGDNLYTYIDPKVGGYVPSPGFTAEGWINKGFRRTMAEHPLTFTKEQVLAAGAAATANTAAEALMAPVQAPVY